MKQIFRVVETYWKEIVIDAPSQKSIDKLIKQQAEKLNLAKEYEQDTGIEYSKDIVPKDKPTYWERFWKITEETDVNWYQQLQPWQRKDLTKEELFQYAEEMRLALDRIFDIAYEFERNGYK